MLMDILRVIILSIVEGVTEFLPISSTGHLILVNQFVKLEPEAFSNAFNVIIQLGAIGSVIVLYFGKLNPFRKPSSQEAIPLPAKIDQMNLQSRLYYQGRTFFSGFMDIPTCRLWSKVVVGVLPSVVLGLLFDDWIDAHLFNPWTVCAMLVLWGIVIIFIERKNKAKSLDAGFEGFRIESVENIDYKTALLIGCFQTLAMVPGTSRSAATIMGAMILGTSRTAAADFSFFLAIPTMVGATLLKVVKNTAAFTSNQWLLILLGSALSFIVALVVIKKFMGYIKQNDFQVFGYYRIILGILVLTYFLFVN